MHRKETASAPEWVLDMLNQARDHYQIGKDTADELWLVIDVDRWGEQKLKRIAQECRGKGFLTAISNPAIELWFLLHLVDLEGYDQTTLDEFLANAKDGTSRTRLEREIIVRIGAFNKSNLKTDEFLPHLKQAIQRAELLDHMPQDRWPQQLGTHVYRLAQSVVYGGHNVMISR